MLPRSLFLGRKIDDNVIMAREINKHPRYYLNVFKSELQKPPRALLRSILDSPGLQFRLFGNFIVKWSLYRYRRIKKDLKLQLRSLTAVKRNLPDFLIFGAQKCGTTSLYQYLIQHPQIIPAFKKEIKYFDQNPGKSIDWYRSHFPSISENSIKLLTGEATPDYIFFPEIAQKVAELIPQIKLIAVFRNPVERAYSQYKYSVWRGFEFASFEEAIDREDERLSAASKNCKQQGEILSINEVYRENSYVSRGLYSRQLKYWLKCFPRKQFLFLSTEDLQSHPEQTLKKIIRFLEINDFHFDTQKRYHQSPEFPEMEHGIKNKLTGFFKFHNEEFFSLIGEKFNW